MNKLTLQDDALIAAVKMADGNPGAINVIGELLNTEMGMIDLWHLYDADIYGSDIWVGYKDVCEGDINKFAEMARSRTLKKAIQAQS